MGVGRRRCVVVKAGAGLIYSKCGERVDVLIEFRASLCAVNLARFENKLSV